MTNRTKGIICGIIAAITYGMNPLGALPLYKMGINSDSVLFYRYSLAAIILGLIMLVTKESFRITLKEFFVSMGLGVVFAISSLSLFQSFHYMDAGVASTLLFIYPIFVAILMRLVFKEALSQVTLVSIALATAGVFLLFPDGEGNELAKTGVALVSFAAFSYASYIVIVNRAHLKMSAIKLTFYVLLSSVLTIVVHSLTPLGDSLQILTTPSMWFFAMLLALGPTVISLVLMAISVYTVGSTPTAIMGALEPLTAVLIGIFVFHEPFTTQLGLGIFFILASVIYLVVGKAKRPKAIKS